MTMMAEFDFSRILEAHSRLLPHVVRTPLLNNPVLDELAGCEIFAKSESLQRTNSFKFRGALNMILQLPEEKLKIGVVAYSSGNHGHGVAAAARIAGAPAVIILPSTASPVKVESCRWWDAKIVTYDQASRLVIVTQLHGDLLCVSVSYCISDGLLPNAQQLFVTFALMQARFADDSHFVSFLSVCHEMITEFL